LQASARPPPPPAQVSLPAWLFQAVLRNWTPEPGSREAKALDLVLRWDATLSTVSPAALIYEYWIAQLPRAVFGPEAGKILEKIVLPSGCQRACARC